MTRIFGKEKRLLDEREKLLAPRPQEATIMREMIQRGGELLPPKIFPNDLHAFVSLAGH